MNARLASRWIAGGALVASILFLLTARSGIALDGNANGISDIWDLLYPSATSPTADSDGDGVNNKDESIWGTNPLLANSPYPGFTLVTVNPGTGLMEISWPSVIGKSYQLQSRPDLVSGSWTNDGATTNGTGATILLTRPMTPSAMNYRVQVSDKDTDLDGVTDWDELAVGLNPNATNSNPDGLSDLAYVTAQLLLPNTVKIQATQPFASEDGPTAGTFSITRLQKLLPITVNYSASGTALVGSDYAALPGSVFIPPGVDTTNVTVTPVPGASVKGSRSVTATLNAPGAGAGFTLDAFNTATVIINESTTPTGTGLLGQYYDTASTVYTNAANFDPAQLKFTRTDATVNFDWLYGTPITQLTSPDNYSITWEGYLSPITAAPYSFQLDANDKARLLVDLDGNGTFELPGEQILENGWDTAATGAYKTNVSVSLVVPAAPANRYRIRLDYIEIASNATCRLQWRTNTSSFVNIPSANVFTTNNAAIPVTNGWIGTYYQNTNFTAPPVRVQTDTTVAALNGGIWGLGSADASLAPDTFSVRWTGQVQPQFTEEYTFVVVADDGCALMINGQPLPLRTVPSANATASYSYTNSTGDAVITYSSLLVAPGSFIVGEIVRLDPTTGNLNHAPTTSPTYSYDGATGLAVINYANLLNVVAGSFTNGETIELDPTSGSLSSLTLLPYTISAATPTEFTVDFGMGTFASGTGNITISDNRNAVVTAASATNFTVNFGPGKYTNGGGNVNLDIINKPLKDWVVTGNERYGRVSLLGGVRYDIRLDYYENTSTAKCQLSWYSPSQPKQIIPKERMYPTPVLPADPTLAPASFIGETDATATVGGLFSYAVTVNNGGAISVSGNPAWLLFNTGTLSGTPPPGSAGEYQILITTTSGAGTDTSVLNLHVVDTGSTIVREYWNGVAGTNVADIPIGTPPSGTNNLSSLQAAADFGDDYGARIRGYITAPLTGNYYFWLAASNAAELWIANDSEPVNTFKRAWVTNGTGPLEWNKAGESKQRSPWLALEGGKKYYIEILHKAGTGAGDNLAVGWAKPGQATNAPGEIVPGHVLSPYVTPPPGSTPGTLYLATMLAQSGAMTAGVGTSTLRLSEDETYATMKYSQSGLTGSIVSQHIHTDPYLTHPSTIVFDIDTPGFEQTSAGGGLQPDGSYKWIILPVGTLSTADIREIIKQGKAYINLHTALYPAGEIRGNYTLAGGSRTFTPPPAPPAVADDHNTDAGAARFLTQATFGPNIADIAALKGMASYEAWIDDQFAKPASRHLPTVLATELPDGGGNIFDETLTFNTWWKHSMTGADQLRQRVAFALSEIHVVSADGPLADRAEALSYFYDKLVDNAFGNFRTTLKDTTLTPAMGRYLDMLKNDKPDQSLGRIPNENYAREIEQLFSVGLYRMWPDGSLILNSEDSPIDTYTQREIVGFAHVFTGWDYGYNGAYRTTLGAATDWLRQMREVPARHFTGPKRILNNEVLPGLATVGTLPLDPYATHTSAQFSDPAYQALPAQELEAAHDQLFNHPNTGPFICRQLIQRLVTSHPSRDYLYRVVQKFNDNSSGVRGDMKAVIKAILLDYEARSPDAVVKSTYGKQREPLMRVAAAARAFRPDTVTGTYNQSASHVITVTAANKLVANNTVLLEFPRTVLPFAPGDVTPTSETYTVLTTPAPTPTTFSVNAKGWTGISGTDGVTSNGVNGNYIQTNGTSTITITIGSHWLGAGHKAYLDFTAETTGTAVSDGVYSAVTSTSTGSGGTAGTTFTIDAPDTTARSGRVRMVRFTGSYSIASSGLSVPNDKRITLDTTFGGNADHHLTVGDKVYLNFTLGTSVPTDFEATVESVPDPNTFTVLTTGPAAQSENGMWMFPLTNQPLTRMGNVNVLPGLFNMGETDADLAQTPLNSPTVFNFFLPDYKFSGTLASQGLTTPEFQVTADTTLIRLANFLYNGVFNPGSANGISSFKSGGNSLVMDLSPWMGPAVDLGLGAGTDDTKPWTDDVNLGSLIDRLNTLLVAGQMSAITKSAILGFVSQRTISSIAAGSPCTVTTSAPHGLTSSNLVVISGVTGTTFSPTINGTYTNTVTGSTTFTVPVNHSSPTGVSVANARVGYLAYTNGGSASDTNKRDRIRAIVHLILNSPDFGIQR